MLEKLEQIDIWRKINREKRNLVSAAHSKYTKNGYVLGHKNIANKCRKAEIINAKLRS